MRAILAVLLSLLGGAAAAQTVPDKTPEELIAFIYQHYVGENPRDGDLDWRRKPQAHRLFEPTLARAIVKANEGAEMAVPDFDPFVEGQDFQIASYKLEVEQKTADKARIVAVFKNFEEPRRVGYDLIRTKAGWRIRNVSGSSDSGGLRKIFKVK